MRLALVLGLLLSGCRGPVTADTFLQSYAQETCKVDQRCYRAWFDANWDSQSACIDDQLSASQDYASLVADCPFDAAKARTCLRNIRKSACADWEDDTTSQDLVAPCKNAWSCGGGDTGSQ